MSTADITDRFCGFLCSLSTEVRILIAEQCKYIETVVKADLETIDSVSLIICGKRSLLEPSSGCFRK